MIQIQAPDGGIIEFPDGTPDSVIENVMRAEFGGPDQPTSGMFDDPIPDDPSQPRQIFSGKGNGVDPTVQIAGKRDLGGAEPYGGVNPYSPFTQGASLGSSDEITAGLMTPIETAANYFEGQGPTDPREVYAQQKAMIDRDKAMYEEQNPGTAIASEIAGGLMSGGMGAKFIASAPSLAGKAIRSGAVGGTVGGTQGFMGTDGNLSDRARSGLFGGGIGATVGTLLPPAFALSRALGRVVSNPTRSLVNKETFAATKVAEALGRDKLSPRRVETRLAANSTQKPDLAVADVAGTNTSGLLRVAANMPSAARQGLIQQLEYRQNNQLSRLTDDLADGFGDPVKFYQTAEKLVSQRKAIADRMFTQAFSTPTPFTHGLEGILKRPIAQQLVERARIAAANRGEEFKNIFVQLAPNGNVTSRRVIDTEGLHRVKMIVDDMIGAMKRREETGLANVSIRDLTIFKKDLLRAIQNDPYKAALSKYSGDSALVNALDDGFENGLRMDPAKIAEEIASLSPSEAELWRLGFSKAVVNSLRDTGRNSTNRADILASPRFKSRITAALPDKAARRDFTQAIQLEQRMFRTRAAVQGNSTTAGQLADGQDAGIEAHNAINAAQTLPGCERRFPRSGHIVLVTSQEYGNRAQT